MQALVSGGRQLINAVGLVELESDGCLQVEICEACGTVRCQSGGWVQLRALGGGWVWTPCFDRLAVGAWESKEYRPPYSLRRDGVPFFDSTAVAQLIALVPQLAGAQPPDLTEREACLIMQLEAPARVLGEPGEALQLRRDLLLAAESGDLTTEVARLEDLLRGGLCSGSPVDIASGRSTGALFIDVPGLPEWRPLAVDGSGRLRLALADDITIAPRERPA